MILMENLVQIFSQLTENLFEVYMKRKLIVNQL